MKIRKFLTLTRSRQISALCWALILAAGLVARYYPVRGLPTPLRVGVAVVLVILGLAKPSLYWWLGGLLLVLLVVRIPRLGPLHALLFTLFQPFALLDSGLSKVKLLSTSVSTTSAISSEMKARSAGLHQTIRDEVREEFQQDIDQNTTVQTHKEQETEKTDRSI